MYVAGNPKTKKQLKEWVASGRQVRVFSLSVFVEKNPSGTVFIEGPHYPEPHRFYAQAQVRDGVIVSVK